MPSESVLRPLADRAVRRLIDAERKWFGFEIMSKVFQQGRTWTLDQQNNANGSEKSEEGLTEKPTEQNAHLIMKNRVAIVNVCQNDDRMDQISGITQSGQNRPERPREKSVQP